LPETEKVDHVITYLPHAKTEVDDGTATATNLISFMFCAYDLFIA
jgi:hypothetical protein